MRPLFIKGHLDSKHVGCMMVAGGASVNIMLVNVFEKLDHGQSELKRTNLSLSGFVGEMAQARGIISKELTVGSKTTPTAFFVVDVRGGYNLLLGCDWIHVNECAPSTLHQCLVQWVGNQVEAVTADDTECVAVAESQVDVQGGQVECLTGRDLSDYDYVSVSKDGFVPISVKPMTSAIRLTDDII
jgi:hypothetical protein